MLKTLGFACCVSIASALKLEADSEKMRGLTDYSGWTDSDAAFKAIIAAGGKWNDAAFPATAESIGGTVADTARRNGGATGAGPKWVSVTEMFAADELKLFAGKEEYSTARQGDIGDCYLIASLAAFDMRPGALEKLFVSKAINAQGAYAMRIMVGGEPVVVVVDDKIPATQRWARDASGNTVFGWHPVYASSAVRGEIWPMIAEKVWAKAHGTYEAIGNGGRVSNVLATLSDDPSRTISLRRGNQLQGFGADNAKGNKLWDDVVKWTGKEYMLWFGTDNHSWTQNHAYGIIWAKELTINGKKQRWIQARNPWGKHDWVGATMSQDRAMYNRDWPEVKKFSWFKSVPGSLEMPWVDFLRQAAEIQVTFGQYKLDGTKQKAEYRSLVKIPTDASATKDQTFMMRITLQEPINLKQDFLNIDAIQGGNRMGVRKNAAFAKGTTGQIWYALYNVDDQSSFTREWGGYAVHPGMWTIGDKGNTHMIDDSDAAAAMPAGTYMLAVTPTWTAYADSNPVLKKLTMRIGSASKLTADYLTEDQATRLSSDGWAKVAPNSKGKRCESWNSMATPRGQTLKQVRDIAVTKSKGYFYSSPRWPSKNSYVCRDGFPTLTDNQWWHPGYKVYEMLTVANPLPANGASATPVVPATPVVTPPVTPVVPVTPVTPVVKPPVTPVAPVAWKPTDPNIAKVTAACQANGYNSWGTTPYRMTNMSFTVNGSLESKYFCEETKNTAGNTRKFTYTFDPKWKVVSHENNPFSATLKSGESVLYIAKFVDKNTAFSWSLYERAIVDA